MRLRAFLPLLLLLTTSINLAFVSTAQAVSLAHGDSGRHHHHHSEQHEQHEQHHQHKHQHLDKPDAHAAPVASGGLLSQAEEVGVRGAGPQPPHEHNRQPETEQHKHQPGTEQHNHEAETEQHKDLHKDLHKSLYKSEPHEPHEPASQEAHSSKPLSQHRHDGAPQKSERPKMAHVSAGPGDSGSHHADHADHAEHSKHAAEPSGEGSKSAASSPSSSGSSVKTAIAGLWHGLTKASKTGLVAPSQIRGHHQDQRAEHKASKVAPPPPPQTTEDAPAHAAAEGSATGSVVDRALTAAENAAEGALEAVKDATAKIFPAKHAHRQHPHLLASKTKQGAAAEVKPKQKLDSDTVEICMSWYLFCFLMLGACTMGCIFGVMATRQPNSDIDED